MPLTGLPTELFDKIIPLVMPEGFESLALTCKGIYALCTPFIERHNKLRAMFRRFYYPGDYMTDPDMTYRNAWDLIIRIAVEPVVAHYFREAHLHNDNVFLRSRPRDHAADATDPHCREAVVKLLANSPHLKQAGLDWKGFHAEIEEDLEKRRYSQRAAAFLLTLLPNVNNITLPRPWEPINATDKLLDVIVREAKQSHLPWDGHALAQVTRFKNYASQLPGCRRFDLNKAVPFLALPHVRSLYSFSCVAIGDALLAIASKDPYRGYGETLEVVKLTGCCIDEAAIADFLKHTPRLKTLRYSHASKSDFDPQDWDICKFVTAIEREAGSHLEELSISIRELRGSILPGKASMRGFQRLRQLQFPLEIAMCNVTFATSMDPTLDYSEPFIGDLVPASVSLLSLLPSGKDNPEKALDVMFRHFAIKKDSQLPALKKILLSHPDCPRGTDAYKKQCDKLVPEVEKVGVVLELDHNPNVVTLSWNED